MNHMAQRSAKRGKRGLGAAGKGRQKAQVHECYSASQSQRRAHGRQHPTMQKVFEVKACWFLHMADHKAGNI